MGTPTIAVGNRRLLKLADFLEKLPKERFNFSSWVGDDWEGAKDLSCGTTACALGWATAMPEFHRLGLKLDSEGWPRYNREVGADAAKSIFAIDSEEAEFLFTPRKRHPLRHRVLVRRRDAQADGGPHPQVREGPPEGSETGLGFSQWPTTSESARRSSEPGACCASPTRQTGRRKSCSSGPASAANCRQTFFGSSVGRAIAC